MEKEEKLKISWVLLKPRSTLFAWSRGESGVVETGIDEIPVHGGADLSEEWNALHERLVALIEKDKRRIKQDTFQVSKKLMFEGG